MERTIIWLDANIDGKENKSYYNELKPLKAKINRVKTVQEAIKAICEISFRDVLIIVSGALFPEFYNEFKANLINIYIIPKIIIFTSNEDAFKNSLGINKNIIGDKFYNIGGIKTDFEEVRNFIEDYYTKKQRYSYKNEDLIHNFSFDYIDSKEKLALPTSYKYLIHSTPQDNQSFFEFLRQKYYNEKVFKSKENEIKKFLDSIIDLNDIPTEVLSKYYVRIYTENSNFYRELNKNLINGNTKDYLSYIKVLYEGIKLGALPYTSETTLYRGTQLLDEEIKTMYEIKNRGDIDDLPGAIIFSRAFLSFSKKEAIAKGFIGDKKEKCSKVLFILKKDINIDFSTSTHVDAQKLSVYDEEEILFFPFSCFKIEKIIPENDILKVKLKYLAKYLKIHEKDFNSIQIKNIPDTSKFKKEIIQSHLINIRENDTIDIQNLIRQYNSSKINIKLNSSISTIYKKPRYIIRRIKLEDKNKFYEILASNTYTNQQPSTSIIPDKNYIIGYLTITERDINENIRILNSYEESKKIYNYIKVKDENYNNEKEIMNKCEIEVNGQKLNGFGYFCIFTIPGEYKIVYEFKSPLRRTDYMFAGCTKLKQFDLSNFYSRDVTNMSCMFMQCISLEELNLDNLDTRKVNDMVGMFYGCVRLTYLDLSYFNTEKVENMSFLFFGCNKLFDLNLSGFDTKNVKDMYCMFSGCISLSSLELLDFNTQNVINMTRMFSECRSLEELNLSKFYTNKVQYMNNMFYGCSSLSKLDISNFSVENIINMEDMFNGCFSLKLENINCKIKSILIKRVPLYS